ncbi:AraC family transcriptional regulator [Pseudaeromonas paramecii]|uniref:AraC family transcriptional regulator n=1 Tax=Pseudaeromonas paramecii TaxID=2138166 RepID=A0ABP8PZ11_9GAMM
MTTQTIHYWHSPLLPGVELCRSHHTNFSYGRHVHLDYHIGLVQQGCQQFIHKGNRHQLVAGRLSTVNPDEVHDGLSLLPEGYQVRVFSLPPAALARWLPEGRERFFHAPLQQSQSLYAGFARLHTYLESPHAEALQAEGWLMSLLAELFCLPAAGTALADPQLRCLRDYLLAHLDQRHTLADLAGLLGLERFVFLRQFKQRTGMTPYAWLKRLRLEWAKGQLGLGRPLAEVALAAGFFDQSHFHHGFRQAYGLTPAGYRQQIRA